MISTARKGQLGRLGQFWVVIAVLAMGCLAAPVRAEIQNDAVGFSTNHVFESSQAGEHIDTMTGNMTLTIPIGPRYKLHDGFSYGVTLYYNAKIWDHECPENAGENTPCPGDIIAPDTYGLGFSIWPARVYHKERDKEWVYRVVLEDGSEHMFCETDYYDESCDVGFTQDAARMRVEKITTAGDAFLGWDVYPNDGRKLILRQRVNVADPESKDALVTRIESVERIPNLSVPQDQWEAAQWVDYNYQGTGSWALSSITDSQQRTIEFVDTANGREIRFPKFSAEEDPVPSAKAVYTLHRAALTVYDPADGVTGSYVPSPMVLDSISYPPELPNVEPYRFAYTRGTAPARGWMLQRTIPTGAVPCG